MFRGGREAGHEAGRKAGRKWELLEPLLPKAKGFGHPRDVDLREILNGIFYVQRTGCQWEMMPHDLPPYTTVYGYFQKWQRKGLWQRIHDKILAQLRNQLGRDKQSTVAIAASILILIIFLMLHRTIAVYKKGKIRKSSTTNPA